MRFARLAAFAVWLTVALLAVAGFAAFSPEPALTTSSTTTVAVARSAGTDWGSTSGRVVALAFSSGLRSALSQSHLSAEDALILDLLDDRPEVTAPTVGPRSAAAEVSDAVSTTTRLPTTTATSPEPGTTPQPSGGSISEAEVRGIVSLFFAPQDVELALEVAFCESRWEPDATNPTSGAAGLFQQIPRYWPERAAAAGWAGAGIYDAHANAAVSAWLVYEGGGWIHWEASEACWG